MHCCKAAGMGRPWVLLNTGFDMLTLAFLFLAAGHGVNIAVLVAGYGVPQLLGKLTVILGGIGVVEATIGWPVRHFACTAANCSGCCPCVSFSVVLAADTGRHRPRDLF